MQHGNFAPVLDKDLKQAACICLGAVTLQILLYRPIPLYFIINNNIAEVLLFTRNTHIKNLVWFIFTLQKQSPLSAS